MLDLTVWRPGPYATQLLAEIGADVVKVEPPGGDPMRVYPELFASLNANKRSIALDLKQPEGRHRAIELATEADVVMEGFRPGVVDRLDVGYDAVRAVNASVVYCSLSGFGQTGPLAESPGHDINYQAWAGALAPDGGAARVGALPIADLAGGMAAAFAVSAAVVRRLRTGTGERIDVAMADVLATWTGGVRPRAAGGSDEAQGVPGYGVFDTADGGAITLGVISEDHFWRALCDVLGLDEWRDLSFADRLARVAELRGGIAAAARLRDRDSLIGELLAADVPAAPVLDRAAMLALPHFRQRSVATADPWAEVATGYPVRFLGSPAARTTPPPALDEHRGTGFRPRQPDL